MLSGKFAEECHTTLACSRSIVPEHAIIIIAEGTLQGGSSAQGHGGGGPCRRLLGLLVLLDLLAGCCRCAPLLLHLLALHLLHAHNPMNRYTLKEIVYVAGTESDRNYGRRTAVVMQSHMTIVCTERDCTCCELCGPQSGRSNISMHAHMNVMCINRNCTCHRHTLSGRDCGKGTVAVQQPEDNECRVVQLAQANFMTSL